MESFVTEAECRKNPMKRACTPAAGLSRQPAVGNGYEARLLSFAAARPWVGEI
jgi:hypothetical protein